MNVLNQKITDKYAAYHGDSCEIIKGIPDNSIGYSVFSPAFRSLYTYSNSVRDMGNASDNSEFGEHFQFMPAELHRITMPGRLCSFHCMLLPTSKERDGEIGLSDFRGELITAFLKAGWIFHSEAVVFKDPVCAMQRTKALGLLHKQVRKDTAMSRNGIPDYLITMRKPGVNPQPIKREYGFTYYAGMNPPDCDLEFVDANGERPRGWREIRPIEGKWPVINPFPEGSDAAVRWSINVWQRYASPVWMDIDPGDTLQSMAEENDERHICPLQLQVIERAIHLWSNVGDTVFSPFMGIGSEIYKAVQMGRVGCGIELKEAYYNQALKNLAQAEVKEKLLF